MTPPTYLLLPMREWDSVQEGSVFQIGDRERWALTLSVARISSGGSITVIVESSPTGEEDSWAQLVAFGAQTAIGDTTKTTYATPTPHFTIAVNRDVYMRARITAITGTAIAEVRGLGVFFDTTDSDHTVLLSQELRGWTDGMDRTVRMAEEEVIELLMLNPETGELDIELTMPGASDAVRREVVLQAEHDMRRAVLGRAHDASSLVSLRELSRGVPGMGRRLRKFRRRSSSAWFGR